MTKSRCPSAASLSKELVLGFCLVTFLAISVGLDSCKCKPPNTQAGKQASKQPTNQPTTPPHPRSQQLKLSSVCAYVVCPANLICCEWLVGWCVSWSFDWWFGNHNQHTPSSNGFCCGQSTHQAINSSNQPTKQNTLHQTIPSSDDTLHRTLHQTIRCITHFIRWIASWIQLFPEKSQAHLGASPNCTPISSISQSIIKEPMNQPGIFGTYEPTKNITARRLDESIGWMTSHNLFYNQSQTIQILDHPGGFVWLFIIFFTRMVENANGLWLVRAYSKKNIKTK